MTELTHEELTRMLDYDPDTGVFRWKVGGGRAKMGSVAGSNGANGRQIKINCEPYKTRRLAWFYVYGEMPRNNLFVKNGDQYDDRISNIGMLPDKPKELTHEYLRQCIDYNPATGSFKWKIGQAGVMCGNDAFYVKIWGNSYICLETSIMGKAYTTNRLIVFWMTGHMPSSNRFVMPIDNNSLNLRWNNLKIGSQIECQSKQRNFGKEASKGVSFNKQSKKYRSQIMINGKPKHLGYFKTEAEAAAAYQKAAREHYGELANDGYQHAIYHMDWEEVDQPDTNVADELLQSAEEAVGITNGTVKPGKVWVPPVVTEEHPVDF